MKKLLVGAIFVCFAMILAACGQIVPQESTPKDVTFADYTEFSVFHDLPVLDMENFELDDADDYGDGYYVLALRLKTQVEEDPFSGYVKLLEDAGFAKHSDNGEDGIGNGAAFTASLQRDRKVVCVSYLKNSGRFYICAAEDKPLSSRLIFDASYTDGMLPDAKTTLTMHQQFVLGNCYVLKLKNGHFIVNDGGYPQDLEPLIRSLKSETPSGEKPVIEAWFFSHDHYDHVAVLQKAEDFADQIIVEGIYSNKVSEAVATDLEYAENYNYGLPQAVGKLFENSAGEETPVFRMHAGERYYFCDITVEVLYTCEQIKRTDYDNNLNASCTWLMYNIEGQKFLLSGDAEIVNTRVVARCYDASYMDVDVMNVAHHGLNLYTSNLGYYNCETLLYSVKSLLSNGSASVRKMNALLMKSYCEEYMSYASGGKRLTFPYTVGSYETLAPWYPDASVEWVQNENEALIQYGLQ